MLSNESAGKPKIGFGLDLTKAKNIQQEHLAKTEIKNAQAKQTAEQAQLVSGQQLSINILNTNRLVEKEQQAAQNNSLGVIDSSDQDSPYASDR